MKSTDQAPKTPFRQGLRN